MTARRKATKAHAWKRGSESQSQRRPLNKQIGGDHYRSLAIQPSEFIYRNGLNWYQGNAVKYICRCSKKGGRQDLEKAIHYLEMLIALEYP